MTNTVYLAQDEHGSIFPIDPSQYEEDSDMYVEAHDSGGLIIGTVDEEFVYKLCDLFRIDAHKLSVREGYFIERRTHREDILHQIPEEHNMEAFRHVINKIPDSRMQGIANGLGDCDYGYWNVIKDHAIDIVKGDWMDWSEHFTPFDKEPHEYCPRCGSKTNDDEEIEEIDCLDEGIKQTRQYLCNICSQDWREYFIKGGEHGSWMFQKWEEIK